MFKLLKSEIDLCLGDELVFNYENPNIMPLEFVFQDLNTYYFLVTKCDGFYNEYFKARIYFKSYKNNIDLVRE